MKTTEVFVEQVLIGFMVLAIGWLPFYRFADLKLGLESAAQAAVAVGVAYLLGIVFDRFADTLLGRVERHILDWRGRLRVGVLAKGEQLADWMEYLRSRIRLARSLAVFLPGLTVSAVLAARCSQPCETLA